MDHVTAIRTAADRFAAVLSTTAPDAAVPTCPDWTAADLAWHLTDVHLFWAGILGDNARTPDDVEAVDNAKPARPDTLAGILDLRADATDALTTQLAALDDAEPRWTWWDADQTVGFTRRMQVCEATMHRVDAELTSGGQAGPIDADVATLCVEHCLDVMWGWIPAWGTSEPLAVAAFEATDTGQGWLVEIGHWTGTGPESGDAFDWPYARRAGDVAGDPTATVRGSLTDLALWSWVRGGDVEVSGSADAVAAIEKLHAHGIQ